LAEAAPSPLRHQRPSLAVMGEAAQLAGLLPHLALEAKQVSAQVQLGIHGRRRAGPGEEFWEFRPFMPGEAAQRIDWRRSARDDRFFVREREWQSAMVHWLWVDLSPSMVFASREAQRPKRERALVLGLALADMLVNAGERVGLFGQAPPMATRSIIARLAEALLRGPPPETAMPESARIKRTEHLVLIGDFILPPEDFAARLAKLAQNGARGTILLIRDPAEEAFPFDGAVEFSGLEAEAPWRVGDAASMAQRYRARISAVTEAMRLSALRHGFGFVKHVTDRPAAEALLALAAQVSGQAQISGQAKP